MGAHGKTGHCGFALRRCYVQAKINFINKTGRGMRRILLLTCTLLLLTLTFSTNLLFAQDGGLQTSLSSGARFRAGPGTEWKLLASLESGTLINLDGRAPGGGWARGIIADGTVGWVVDTALAASAEQIAALPSVWVDTPFSLGAPQGGPAPIQAAPQQPEAPAVEQPQQPAAPSTTGLAEGVAIEVGSRVNLRAEPTRAGAVLATLSPGMTVYLDGRDETQYWVRAAIPGGAKGWTAAQFLVMSAAEVAALPIVTGGASASPAQPAPAQAASDPAVVPTVIPAAAVVETAPVRGFSYGGHIEGLSERTINAMRTAGMTWVKRQWRYQAGQNPNDVAGIINEAHAYGFRILIGIVGSTSELNNGGYFDQYAGFVGGVAALGADAIEVWNEMNIDREWPSGSIDPGQYTQLLRVSYNAIKGANPNTMVISGAPAPTGFFGGCSPSGCDDSQYIAGMAAAGAANYMDCLGAHYNEGIVSPDATSGDPRGNSDYFTSYFWGMVNTYSRAFRNARPICFTELGYLTGEGYPPLPGGFAWAGDVTVAQQAAWLDRAVALSASSGKVRLLIVWNVDFQQYGDDPMAGYAIIRPDGGCPACEALGR